VEEGSSLVSTFHRASGVRARGQGQKAATQGRAALLGLGPARSVHGTKAGFRDRRRAATTHLVVQAFQRTVGMQGRGLDVCSPWGSGMAGSPWRGEVMATVCGVGRHTGARGSMAGIVPGGEDMARWCSKAPAWREALGWRWLGGDVV
jgi:hypothetical protein